MQPDEKVSIFLSTEGEYWKFIPPKSPNFGGIWEAGVKSLNFMQKELLEDNLLIAHWIIGKIVQTYPGTDGKIKVVQLKLANVGYFNDYKKITVNTVRTSWRSVRDIHKDIFDKIVSVIEEDVVKKRNYLLLTSLCDMYNKELQEELIHQPKANLIGTRRSKKLEENDLIDKVAFILRSTILKMDKTTLPAVMKMEDLINGECTILKKLDRFFKALIGGKDVRCRYGVNCNRLSNSLASDAIIV
ncbi:hypothetical protein TNCV_3997111 [Trichonephila clavipes]|nr:hypothetical protein TNCV_3997111 [Trichonephila clavipes]